MGDSYKSLGLDEDTKVKLTRTVLRRSILTVFGKFGNLNFIARVKSKLITYSLFQY